MMVRRAAWLVALVASVFLLSGFAQNYAPAVNFSTQNQPDSIARGDFNNDGRLDFAVSFASANVEIFFGNGDGTFQ